MKTEIVVPIGYFDEHYHCMLSQESSLIMDRSVYLSNWDDRQFVINFMVFATMHCEFDHNVVHRAVRLMDHVLHQDPTIGRSYMLMSAACFFIAAKFEHMIHRLTPGLLVTNFQLDHEHSEADLVRMELRVLGILKFKVGIPIAPDYLAYHVREATEKYAWLDDYAVPIGPLCDYLLMVTLSSIGVVEWQADRFAEAVYVFAERLRYGFVLNHVREILVGKYSSRLPDLSALLPVPAARHDPKLNPIIKEIAASAYEASIYRDMGVEVWFQEMSQWVKGVRYGGGSAWYQPLELLEARFKA